MSKKHIAIVPEVDVVSRKNKKTKKAEPVKIPRKAVAPYNFIELPDNVVESDISSEIDSHDCYRFSLSTDRPSLSTGYIDCTLITASPLYIRAGFEAKAYTHNDKESHNDKEPLVSPDFYYTNPATKQPVLPASSLRGLFRSLVEIVSFSKISKVSDQERFFFRAVAAFDDDPVGTLYKQNLKNVKAGHLREVNGQWFIKPAKSIEEETFIRIEDKDVTLPGFTHMSSDDYRPQYISNVSFSLGQKKRIAEKISRQPDEFGHMGVLVTSGNMMETGKSGSKTDRKYHYLVGLPDENADTLKINEHTVSHYRQSLTPFQKYGTSVKDENSQSPFSEKDGFLKNRRCVFYCEPAMQGGEVTLFGQSPNFRIPYSFDNNGEAASALDFVPTSLRDEDIIDITERMFGYVRDEKQSDRKKQARAGKVSFLDGICQETNLDKILMPEVVDKKEGLVPKILASPKPTTFQHYLVQTSEKKKALKHYASKPEKETVIRGHKMYWHQGKSPDIWHPSPEDASKTQITHIRPIKPSIVFKFKVEFENLSSVELGALLWVLRIAQADQYRLSLGMGKPLGMGAVKIESDVLVGNRCSRYKSLFEPPGEWYTGIDSTLSKSEKDEHIQNFEQHVLKGLNRKNETEISQLRRIQMLLAMLEWQEVLSEKEQSQRRYMEIERDVAKDNISSVTEPGDTTVDEYSERPILPTPLQVVGRETLANGDLLDTSIELTRIDNPAPEVERPSVKKKRADKKVELPQVLESVKAPKTEKQNKRQEVIASIITNQCVKEGDLLEAKVLKKGSKKKVTYEVGTVSFNEKESKNYDVIPEGEVVKVRVTSLIDGIIKHIKFVEPT